MTLAVVLDILLVLLLLRYAVWGYRNGLFVGTLAVLGFLAGGFVGMWLLPQVVAAWPWAIENDLARRVLLVVGVFVLASIGQGIVASLAGSLRSRVTARPVRTVDSALGAVAGLVALSLLLWFVAAALRGAPSTTAARVIGESRVLAAIDRAVPPQTAGLFSGFRQMLDTEGWPRVFDGLGAEPITPVEPPSAAATAAPAIREASNSVVKVVGNAVACGRGQEGSGFVVAPQRVVTNAHVVAGMPSPQVQVLGVGPRYDSRIVVFDPERDLAVLDVPGLSAPTLPLGSDLERGDSAVVAGFPLNGPYQLDAARVRSTLTATGSDIYGTPGTVREIYSLYTTVEPGNSGGPLLSEDGTLAGVVFAKSTDDDTTGYALTLREAEPVLTVAASANQPVDSGACTAD